MTKQFTADDLVSREVHYCVSHLVATLAQGVGLIENSNPVGARGAELSELCEQALEACTPVPDWEEAAIQAGWRYAKDTGYWEFGTDLARTAEAACDADNLDPYEREIMEHWVVSDWLAMQLEDRGERIVRDMAGMTVWGRTCSGQAIAQDAVIQDIHAAMMARV